MFFFLSLSVSLSHSFSLTYTHTVSSSSHPSSIFRTSHSLTERKTSMTLCLFFSISRFLLTLPLFLFLLRSHLG